MRTYAALIERCLESGMLVGSIPDLQGARTQAASLDEPVLNLREVIELITVGEDQSLPATKFVGLHMITV